MRLLSYNGVSFASLNLGAGIPDDWTGQQNMPLVLSRRGYNPLHLGLARGTKTLLAQCTVMAGFDGETNLLNLFGVQDPYDETERILVGQLNDGVTTVQCYAALVGYRGVGAKGVELSFSVADPVWRKQTPTTAGPLSWPDNAAAALPTPNAGKARANLTVTIKPTSLNAATAEFQYARTIAVTNNSDTPLRRYPLRLDLGNTSTWTGAASNSDTLVWCFLDGLSVPKTIVGWNRAQTFMWILVSELAPGATANYQIAYYGKSAAPTVSGLNAPAFTIESDTGTATAATASTLTDTAKTWVSFTWNESWVYTLTGTGAGQSRRITQSTANQLTVSPNWTTTPAAGTTYLIAASSNAAWLYRTAQNSRSGTEDKRGLWYINKGQTPPSKALPNGDTPGGFARYLMLDNNDEKNNTRWFPYDVGGGDLDYFCGLDAHRTAQGWDTLKEGGQADGVTFSSPIPITDINCPTSFRNPNGICEAFIGYRESGAEDWAALLQDGTAYASLGAGFNAGVYTLTGDVRHLVFALLPRDEVEIPVDWKRDTGSRTGGGSSTLDDASKTWTDGQWNGATVYIRAGTGAGQKRTVTTSTSVRLNVTPNWATIPSDDSRYEVINPVLMAYFRQYDATGTANTPWKIGLDSSKFAFSALSAEAGNYSLIRGLRLGGGPDLNLPYQRARIGQDGRKVFVAASEELRIAGATRRAAVYTTASGVLARDVTSGVTVQNVDGSGTWYAPEWLPVSPTPAPPSQMPNTDFAANISGWSELLATAGLTRSETWDNTQGHLVSGTLKVDVTASTAAAGAIIRMGASGSPTAFIPVVPGRTYTATAWARKSSANWTGLIGIEWFTTAGASISINLNTVAALSYVAATAAWYPVAYTMTAPATAATARVLLVAYETVTNSTGTVWFDEVAWDTTALFMDAENSGVATDVSAALTEGYHG